MSLGYMMYTKEYYYVLFFSAISSKIMDILYILSTVCLNIILGETEKLSNIDVNTKQISNHLLMEIANSYYGSTNGVTRYNHAVIPLGFVLGKSGYIVYIDHQLEEKKTTIGIDNKM